MPKAKSLKDLLASLTPEQTQELRDALLDPDADIQETIVALQKQVTEILEIVKPKPGPKDKPAGALEALTDFLGVK